MKNYFVTYDLRTRYTTADYARVEEAIRRVETHAVKVLYTV